MSNAYSVNQFFHPFVRLFVAEASRTNPTRLVIRRICTSIGNIFLLHANNKTQAAVLGPTPVSDVRNSLASSIGDVCKRQIETSLLFLISLSAFLMTIDLALANPPDLIAAAMDDARARRADSQSGKRCLRFSESSFGC